MWDELKMDIYMCARRKEGSRREDEVCVCVIYTLTWQVQADGIELTGCSTPPTTLL